MKIPPKKLKALVEREANVRPFAKGKPAPKQEEHDEEEEHAEHEDEEGEEHDEEEAEGEDHDDESDKMTPEEIGAMVQNGHGDEELMELAEGVDEDSNPPEWVEDEDTWEKAKKAVKKHWDDYDLPYAVVTHVYKSMHGGIKAEG